MNVNSKDIFYVSVQFLIFGVFIFAPASSHTLPKLVQYPGMILMLAGVVVTIVAMVQLNRNLTAFPTPKDDAHLYTGGLYSFARHPIYTGVILMFLGISLYLLSISNLFITAVLIIFFHFKTTFEEAQLQKKYAEYDAYKIKTGKFFPYLK